MVNSKSLWILGVIWIFQISFNGVGQDLEWLTPADSFEWPTPASDTPRLVPESRPLSELPDSLREIIESQRKKSKETGNVTVAFVDLNGDSSKEVFIRLSRFSSNGSSYYAILTPQKNGYRPIGGIQNPDEHFLGERKGWLQIQGSFKAARGKHQRYIASFSGTGYRVSRSEVHDFETGTVTVHDMDKKLEIATKPAATAEPKNSIIEDDVDWVSEIKKRIGSNLVFKSQPNKEDWEAVEKELGLSLPSDYKALLSHVGAGEFFSDKLFLFLPDKDHPNVDIAEHSESNMELSERLLRENQLDPEEMRRSIYPRMGDLLQFAGSPSAFGWFWETSGNDPDQWPIIMVDLENGTIRSRTNITVSEFIFRALSGDPGGHEMIRDYMSNQKGKPRFVPLK